MTHIRFFFKKSLIFNKQIIEEMHEILITAQEGPSGFTKRLLLKACPCTEDSVEHGRGSARGISGRMCVRRAW